MAVSVTLSFGTFLSTCIHVCTPSGPPERIRAGAGQELPPSLAALQAVMGVAGPRESSHTSQQVCVDTDTVKGFAACVLVWPKHKTPPRFATQVSSIHSPAPLGVISPCPLTNYQMMLQ